MYYSDSPPRLPLSILNFNIPFCLFCRAYKTHPDYSSAHYSVSHQPTLALLHGSKNAVGMISHMDKSNIYKVCYPLLDDKKTKSSPGKNIILKRACLPMAYLKVTYILYSVRIYIFMLPKANSVKAHVQHPLLACKIIALFQVHCHSV